jgi:hypothetical protein
MKEPNSEFRSAAEWTTCHRNEATNTWKSLQQNEASEIFPIAALEKRTLTPDRNTRRVPHKKTHQNATFANKPKRPATLGMSARTLRKETRGAVKLVA